MVRCFIGVMIPEELREKIELVKKGLEKLPMKCKFVERENLHFCLSFLGDTEGDELNNISNSLKAICNSLSKFEVVIDGIKLIPNEKYIRVLALGVIDRSDTLNRIRKEIQKRIGGSSYSPHLTLCRVKNIGKKSSTIRKIKSIKTREARFTVSSIQIIKSELRKTGPIYTSIFEAMLR